MMVTWNFKTVGAAPGNSLVHLTEAQMARVSIYQHVLSVALESRVPQPTFSNYFVRAAVSNGDIVVPAGNIEYGLCQALHAEESAVAALRASLGKKDIEDKTVIGIVAGEEGNVATPCGNCRDIMLDTLGKNIEIVSGAPTGGTAVVVPFERYLYDVFPAEKELPERLLLGVGRHYHLLREVYMPSNIHQERVYVAAVSSSGSTRVGTLSIGCDFHPIYPIENALRRLWDCRQTSVDMVTIVTSSEIPHVMYRDRQALYNAHHNAELLAGKKSDPQIVLITIDENGVPTQGSRTSVKEWLPFPFSTKNFGSKFEGDLARRLKDAGLR